MTLALSIPRLRRLFQSGARSPLDPPNISRCGFSTHSYLWAAVMAAASRGIPGPIVVLIEAWPSISISIRGGTPAASRKLAHE